MIRTRKRGNCVFKAKKRRSDEQRRRKGERKERREKKVPSRSVDFPRMS
jgi:hypothetical protein